MRVVREELRPLPHSGPVGPSARLRFAARLVLDLQVRTVHRHLRRYLPLLSGTVLDLGCGQSPYRHMLGPGTRYLGIDFEGSRHFEYVEERDVTYFDGRRIPLEDGSIDHVLCTEVLEHCPEPGLLLREVHRVMKPGASGVFTVPWSARYHYIPHDYCRYTPSMLRILFRGFSRAEVEPRGTDVTAITAKLIVLALRPLLGGTLSPLTLLETVCLLPVVPCAVLAGQLSLVLGLGSSDDPLGYTVWITK